MTTRGRRRRPAACGLLLVLVAAAMATPHTDAGFTSAKTNPSNGLAAASSFVRDTASGTYTGNGADNRSIAGLSFQPDIVLIKSATTQGAVLRTRTMTGDVSKPLFGTTALASNRIQALQSGGFQVGTDATVNASGITYQWYAATTSVGAIAAGSYTGDGAVSRAISGLGHSPEAVIVMPATAQAPVLRFAPMTTSFRFETGTGVGSAVESMTADGFTVGSSASSNSSGVEYHWISMSETPGTIDVGSYTGNGATSRSITGLGFTPGLALVRSSSTTTSRAGLWRSSAVTDSSSFNFAAAANVTNGITALTSGGFTLGNNAATNASSNPYAYLAVSG